MLFNISLSDVKSECDILASIVEMAGITQILDATIKTFEKFIKIAALS